MSTPLVEYELMRPGEIAAARDRTPLVFVPVSPIEWHGPHLPLGTDGLHAHHIAVRVARRVGGVVLPTTFLGTDSLHVSGAGQQGVGIFDLPDDERVVGMDLPGFPVKSLYIHETVFGTIVRELVRALKADPWKLIVLVGGHGAPNQQRMLERIAAEENVRPWPEVRYETAWPSGGNPSGPSGGHADRLETSLMLALEGDRVRLDELPAAGEPLVYKRFGIVDGRAFDGEPNEGFAIREESDPRGSSLEEGERIVEIEVDHLSGLVAERLAALGGS